MKIFNRITSIILACALLLGCLSIGAFAIEADTDTLAEGNAELPTANGILSIAELQKLDSVSGLKGYEYPTMDLSALGNGTNAMGIFSAGDGYLKVQKNTKSGGDSFIDLWNDGGKAFNTRDALKANATEEDLGASFVLSADLKAENYSNAQETVVFQIRSYVCETGSSAINLLGIGNNSNGKTGIWYRSALAGSTSNVYISNHDLPLDRFETVAVFVTPRNNSYSVYIDGVLAVKDVRLFTDAEAQSFVFPSAQITAKTDADGKDASYKNYIISICRMFYTWVGSGSATYPEGTDVIGADNIKFYYAKSYVECAAHNFDVGVHTHNEDGSVAYGAMCNNCAFDLTEARDIIDENNDGICDGCAESKPTASGILTLSDLRKNPEIRALNGDEFNTAFTTTAWLDNGLYANNSGFHSAAEESGNKYIKVGGNTKNADNYIGIFNAPIPASSLNNRAYIQSMIKNGTYGDFAGRSFVVSVDIKIEDQANVINNTPIVMFSTYATQVNGSKYENYLLKLNVKEDENGIKKTHLTYNVGNTSYVISDHTFGDTFETVSVFVTPSKNTYNIYIDGELFVSDIPFMAQSELDNILLYNDSTAKVVTDASGKEIRGGDAYILAFARFFQINSYIHGADKYSLGIDNLKLYFAEEYIECANHEFSLTSTRAKENGNIELSYSCGCGASYSAMSTGVALDSDVVILGRSASLGDLIGLKLYADIGKRTLEAEDAKMVITMGDKTVAEISLSELEKSLERYVFEFKFTSTEMSEIISAKIVTADGETKTYETSFEAYAVALLEGSTDAKLTNLLKATLNYGAYAEEYFAAKNGKIFDDAPDKLLESDINGFDVATLDEYNVTVSGESSNIIVGGATLVLESTTTLKVFFTGGTSVILGENGDALEIKQSGNYSYVEIKNITPQRLAKSATVIISDGNESVSVELSVLACAKIVITRDSFGDEFKALAKAIVLYCKAAEAYVA